MTVRLWIAKVYDAIYVSSLENTDVSTSLEQLRVLQGETVGLPLRCGEETQLQNLLREAESYLTQAQAILAAAESPAAAAYDKLLSIAKDDHVLSISSLGTSSSSSTNVATTATLHPPYSESTTVVATTKQPPMSVKCDILEVNSLLWRAKRCPISFPETKRLEALYNQTLHIREEVDAYLDVTEAVQSRRKRLVMIISTHPTYQTDAVSVVSGVRYTRTRLNTCVCCGRRPRASPSPYPALLNSK